MLALLILVLKLWAVTPQQKYIQVIKIYVYTPKYHLLKIKQSKTLKVEVNDKINIK